MRDFDEVRLFLAGDEYEVRALTAAELLRSRTEAREIARTIGAEEGDEAIVSAAAVVSASLYRNGERAFHSAADALESLTLSELMEAAAVNDFPEEREKTPGLPEEAAGTFVQTAGEDLSERRSDVPKKRAADEERAAAGRERHSPEPERPAREEKRRDGEDGRQERRREFKRAGLFSFSGQRRRKEGVASIAGAEETGPMITAEDPGADMRSVSGFFERDSRRYDGAFERY